jgi:hypothetical protein
MDAVFESDIPFPVETQSPTFRVQLCLKDQGLIREAVLYTSDHLLTSESVLSSWYFRYVVALVVCHAPQQKDSK